MAAVCVTQEMCKAWEKSGKSDFLKFCKSCISAKSHCFESTGDNDLKRALYDVCWQALRGSLKIEQLVQTLIDVADLHPEVPSLLADILGVLDIESVNNDEKDRRERLMTLIPECYVIVPEPLMKACLDQDTLENIGLLSSKQTFQQKYVKTKTKLFYKQQKFNLLREENEGYSKLITELNQDFTNGPSYLVVLENIKSLIGCFNLDPNRVLDTILESFERRLDVDELFVPLLQTYMSDQSTVCHMLGFKFHFYQQTQDSETPSSLYKLAAILLQHDLIQLDTLYPHLSPADSDITEHHKRELLEARQYARKLNIVMLSDKANDKDKEDKENKLEQNTNNQKLGLCEACIQIGNWKHAKLIMDRLPPFVAVGHKPVAHTLCNLVSYIIEPLYLTQAGLPEALIKHRTCSADSQNLPRVDQATSWVEMVRLAFPLACCLGPHLACDPVLMGKLVRLARSFMEKRAQLEDAEEADEVFRGFLSLTDEVILPSLSQLPCNCCMAEEVWSFLRLLQYEHRYRLYGQWKNDRISMHPKLIRIRADAIDKSKYIMKRLAKENVKQMGRQIGKLSHSNPGVLFEFILSQIQKYDNFIGPVVDSLKFLTGLSYDVMAYCIIEALANPERERLKHDDTNISLWLQSLASFSGSVLKKYQIDLAGITQYVANQLKAGKSYDLLIIREIVQKMVGIEVSEEVTDDQLEAMSGGELLRQEGGYFSQVRNTKKSSTRLKEALLEHNLAVPLCLLMAQQRNGIVFTPDNEDKRHIKLIGKLYDQCQDTLVQFITFLSLQMSTEEFEKRLPSIDDLMLTYQVSPDVAFALWRITYASAIQSKYDEFRKADRKEKQESNSQSAKVKRYMEACESVMDPIRDLIYPLNPPKVWDEISLQFYTTFWSLTKYDLQVPSGSYDKQRSQLKSQVTAIEDNKDLAQSKKKKEKERCQSLIDRLTEEEKRQEEHVKMVRNRLKQEKDTWFASKSVPKQSMITAVLQLCLFPRCCFTTNDAVYCARFLHIVHSLKTPNFSSLICYDRIFTEATWAISSCTESEAHRFGRFLCAVLDDIMRWHSDKGIFDKECANFPGFVTVFRVPKSDAASPPADSLDFENYRHVVHKWQYSLCVTACNNIDSKDYIQTRNALIVLTKMLPHFPRVLRFGNALERRVDRLCQEEKEKRPDLYALAMGYIGQLKMKRKTWIEESEFHMTKKPAAPSSTQKTASADKKSDTKTAATEDSATSKDSNGSEKKDTNASKDKKIVRSSSRSEQKENRDVKESKDVKVENNKTESKEQRDNSRDSSKDRRSKAKENGRESKSRDTDKESKTKDKEAKVKEVKVRNQDKEVKDKEKRHKDKKEEKSPKEEKPSKEERELAKKEERERRKEEKEREKQLSEERARIQKEEMEKERSKEERERMKEEKREARAAEKLKEKERRREREYLKDKDRDADKDHWEEKSRDRTDHREYGDVDANVGSNSHGHRRSADPSPKHSDDRDVKRRKLEVKESGAHHSTDYWDRPHKSPSHNRSGADYDSPRDREKRDRKRVSLDRSIDDKDHSLSENKRHRLDDSGTTEKQNGDPREKLKDKRRSIERDRESRSREAEPTTNHASKTKSSPDKGEKERRKSDKHSSNAVKKSKHH